MGQIGIVPKHSTFLSLPTESFVNSRTPQNSDHSSVQRGIMLCMGSFAFLKEKYQPWLILSGLSTSLRTKTLLV